jgi:hypothetical protein
MSFNVEFDPKADNEYFEAWDWYESQLTGLGDRFGRSIIKHIKIISDAPLAFPNKKSDVRECKVEDFPFLVVYKVFPEKKLVYITSIFHTSRNPKKKYRR